MSTAHLIHDTKPYECDVCHEQRDAHESPPTSGATPDLLICEDCSGAEPTVPASRIMRERAEARLAAEAARSDAATLLLRCERLERENHELRLELMDAQATARETRAATEQTIRNLYEGICSDLQRQLGDARVLIHRLEISGGNVERAEAVRTRIAAYRDLLHSVWDIAYATAKPSVDDLRDALSERLENDDLFEACAVCADSEDALDDCAHCVGGRVPR